MSEGRKYGYSVSDLTEFDIAVHHAVCKCVDVKAAAKEKMKISAKEVWIMMGNSPETLTSQICIKMEKSMSKLMVTPIRVSSDGDRYRNIRQFFGDMLLPVGMISGSNGELERIYLTSEPILHRLARIKSDIEVQPIQDTYYLSYSEFDRFRRVFWNAPKDPLYDSSFWEDVLRGTVDD